MSRTGSSSRRPLRIAAGLLVPVVAFLVFLRTLGNATEALAVAEAIPVLWVLVYAVWRRRLEPVGAAAVAGVAIALLLTLVLGGSPRPLELHRALFPGAVGLACLISLAVGRPLLSIAAVKRRDARPDAATRLSRDTPGARRALRVMTAIIGVTLTTDAAAQVALAFTVSTSTFGVVAHIASWAIIGTGVAVGVLYVRGIRARLRETPTPASRSRPTLPRSRDQSR